MWTGKEAGLRPSRDTAAVVRELFTRAEKLVVIGGFRFDHAPHEQHPAGPGSDCPWANHDHRHRLDHHPRHCRRPEGATATGSAKPHFLDPEMNCADYDRFLPTDWEERSTAAAGEIDSFGDLAVDSVGNVRCQKTREQGRHPMCRRRSPEVLRPRLRMAANGQWRLMCRRLWLPVLKPRLRKGRGPTLPKGKPLNGKLPKGEHLLPMQMLPSAVARPSR